MDELRSKEIDEQKEKEAIELENKMLTFLLPSVGLVAVVIGIVGFILAVNTNLGGAIFLLILALLGLGGVGFGVFKFINYQRNKYRKPDSEPSQEPNKN